MIESSKVFGVEVSQRRRSVSLEPGQTQISHVWYAINPFQASMPLSGYLPIQAPDFNSILRQLGQIARNLRFCTNWLRNIFHNAEELFESALKSFSFPRGSIDVDCRSLHNGRRQLFG